MTTTHLNFLALLTCIIISLLLHTHNSEAAAEPQNDCKRKCADIKIPYPFGMKKGCYLDARFEVSCNESSRSASITQLQGSVDSISVSTHTVRIKDRPVLTLPFNTSGDSVYGHALDFYYLGNQYTISHSRNKFVATGCDFYAYLVEDETKELIGGCAALCSINGTAPSPSSPCSGLNCCHTNITHDPRHLVLHVDTINTLRKSWRCGFFAFLDKNFPLEKINFSVCEERYTVPVIYEWTPGNKSCSKAVEEGDYICGTNTYCIDTNAGTGYRCKCLEGFTGNPYLLQGCIDFDECANEEDNNCPVQDLCVNTEGSYFCSHDHKHMFAKLIILGISLTVGFLILVSISLWIWQKQKEKKHQKTKQRFFKRNGGLLLQHQISSSRGSVLPELTLFTIDELEKATDKFSEARVLGKGGLGTVYKGMLSDGRIVAVKKANITTETQVSQFINEVFILSQISHRHIVKLFGCCLETEVPLLIYEHISNGTLSHHIHNKPNLSWENRLRIAAEVAGALAYLHSHASTAIYHRDIKSSNVLLDENYKAVVSDFGLSRSVSIERTHLTTLVGGTFGYLDPEYFQSGQLNDKSDVYAFGIVLAEILTGQRAVSSAKDDVGLSLRFRAAMKELRLFDILEKAVASEAREEDIVRVANIVKRCIKTHARKRPTMKEVAAELDHLRKVRELRAHQESFLHQHHSSSENMEVGSEAEDDQTMPF